MHSFIHVLRIAADMSVASNRGVPRLSTVNIPRISTATPVANHGLHRSDIRGKCAKCPSLTAAVFAADVHGSNVRGSVHGRSRGHVHGTPRLCPGKMGIPVAMSAVVHGNGRRNSKTKNNSEKNETDHEKRKRKQNNTNTGLKTRERKRI